MYRQSEKTAIFPSQVPTIWRTWAHWRLRSVYQFGAPQQISTGFASWLRYCSDVAQWKPTKFCTMFGRLLRWYTIYTFWLLLPHNEILPGTKFNLRPRLALSYIGSVTPRHSSSGRQPNCGVEQRAPPIFGRAAVTLGIGRHYSCVIVYSSKPYVCFCCVRFSFFSTMPRDWLRRTSPKWPILWRVERKIFIKSMFVVHKPRLHDATCCQSGCQTGLTTGCIVCTNIQPVVKPVEPVWQNGCIVYTAGCQTGCTTRFDNRLNEQSVRSTRLSKRVWQPVDQTVAVHSTRLSNRLLNPFDNRFDNCVEQTVCSTRLSNRFDNR